jgi:hypothetical protein
MMDDIGSYYQINPVYFENSGKIKKQCLHPFEGLI